MNAELTQLATEITEHLAAALNHHRLGLEAYRTAGEKLIDAQAKVYAINGGRKGFGAWLKQQPSLPTYAQCLKYMRLARNWKLFENDYDLTLSAANERIDAAEGKTKATDADQEADQDAHQVGSEATQGQPDATETPTASASSENGKPGRTNKLGNTAYRPFLDGSDWKVTVEASENDIALLLPLCSEKHEAKPLIKLAKSEARQLVSLLANLI
jgi:hypothetical protein